MAVLKYKDPQTDQWVPIGIPGVTRHHDLTDLDTGDDHPQYLLRSGGVMTGPVTLHGDPIADLDATSRQYVDNRVGAYVQPSDPGNPATMPLGVRGPLWVDTDDGADGSEFLPTHGGTITGHLVVEGMFVAPSAPSGVAGHRKITISTEPPPEGFGADGDIWFQRST